MNQITFKKLEPKVWVSMNAFLAIEDAAISCIEYEKIYPYAKINPIKIDINFGQDFEGKTIKGSYFLIRIVFDNEEDEIEFIMQRS